MTAPVVVAAAELRTFAADALAGLGVPRADATVAADVLVYADLRGLEAHGMYRLPGWLDRVAAGTAGSTAALTVHGSGAVRRIDAGQALGPAAAVRATDLATELAREHGIGLVAVGRSTHFGAAGYYALRAARRELVAFVTSNAPRVVAPSGAADLFLGTDPIAIGVPLGRHGAFVHDMATSPSKGRIRQAAETGAALEPGLAVDADGHPTTDAAAALLGSILPMGGPKGSGLALAVALLCGMLGGAQFDDELAPSYGDGAADRVQNIGHVIVAIDPWRLSPRAQTLARAEALVDRLHALRPVADGERVRFPGERAARTAAERERAGIPVPGTELRRWAAACAGHGLTGPARWAATRAAG